MTCAAAVTDPDPAPVLTPRFALPAKPLPRPAPPRAPVPTPPRAPVPPPAPRLALPFDIEQPERPATPPPVATHALAPASNSARLLAWSFDGALIAATSAACIAASLRVGHVRYPLDFLRAAAPLFGALVVVTAVAYGSLLTALCGRTPGMALAGHRLRRLDGRPPTASEAMWRALLALPSVALGLFGFTLALFDRRGQTLHDKLSGCITVVD